MPERVFGQLRDDQDLARLGDRADLVGDMRAQVGDHVVAPLDPGAQDDEGHDALAGGLIGGAHDGGLGDLGVGHQRGLDLGRGDPVS